MAQTIKLKRSSVASAVPSLSSLELGEVAINTNDGAIYIKRDDGSSPLDILAIHHEPTMHIDYTNNRIGIGTTAPATALDVTGVITTDGLTVDGDATIQGYTNETLQLKSTNTSSTGWVGSDVSIGRIEWYGSSSAGNGAGIKAVIDTQATTSSGRDFDLLIKNSTNVGSGEPTLSLRIDANKDISFYENTGTTAKFFWDASAESLGIGTTTPDNKLHVVAGADGEVAQFTGAIENRGLSIFVETATDASALTRFRANSGGSAGQLAFNTDGNERMRIDEDGKVGIGTTSPQTKLHVREDGAAVVGLKLQNATANSVMEYQVGNDADNWFFGIDGSDNFGISDVAGQAAQKLVITQGGNVGIGTNVPEGSIHVLRTNEASLVLSGDANNTDDDGRVDAAVYLLHDVGATGNDPFGNTDANSLGTHGFRLSSENHSGISAFSVQEWKSTSGYLDRLYISNKGHVSVGETRPNIGWQDAREVLQINEASFATIDETQITIGTNYYYDGSNNKLSVANNRSSVYEQSNGNHTFYTFNNTSTAADANITFSPILTLNADETATFAGTISSGAITVTTDTEPKILVVPSSTSGADATIEIRGARGGPSTGVEVATLLLSNYDADIPDVKDLAKITSKAVDNADTDLNGQKLSFEHRVSGALSEGMYLYNNDLIVPNGNVGIGTDSPSAKLDTAYTDSATYSSTSPSADLILSRKNTGNTASETVGIRFDVTGWSGTTTGGAAIEAIQPSNASTADLAFLTRDAGTWGERMRIDSSGNVGIGTATPTKKLTVFGTGAGNATVQIEGEGGADPYINFLANNTQHWSLGVDDSDADKFKLSEHSALGTNDYFVVDVTGNVGIGVTSPTYRIEAAATSGGSGIKITRGSDSFFEQFQTTTGGVSLAASGSAGFLALRTGTTAGTSTEAMRIDADGNVGIGTDSPLAAGSSYTVVDIGSASTASLLNMTDNGTETGRIVAESNQLHFSSGTASGFIGFRTGGFSAADEAMRIDSGGRLLVSGTSALTTSTGIEPTFQIIGQSAATGSMYISRDENTTSPAVIYAYKSRNSGAIVLDNDSLFSINVDGSDGIGPIRAGTIKFEVDGTPATNNIPTAIVFERSDGAAGLTESMRIDGAGNVGIGTTNPSAFGAFAVKSTGTQIALTATTGPATMLFDENGVDRFFIKSLSGSDGLAFVDADGSSERLRIDSSGNVGIGTTSPVADLQIGDFSGSQKLLLAGANATSDSSQIIFSDAFNQPSPFFAGMGIRYNSSTNKLIIESHFDTGASPNATTQSILTLDREDQSATFAGTISSGDITTSGVLHGPSTFYIDPSPDDTGSPGGSVTDTGTVVILGDLQVTGTTTTIDSTVVDIADLNITLAKGAANAAAANGAGIIIDCGTNTDATFTYDSTRDSFEVNKPFNGLHVDTNSNTDPLKISRVGAGSNEVLNIGVLDRAAIFNYIEDTSTEGAGNYAEYRFQVSGDSSPTGPVTLLTLSETAATFGGDISTSGDAEVNKIETTKAQHNNGASTNAHFRALPSATTDTTGLTSLFLGTSVLDGYGVSLNGARKSTDGTPTFTLRTHNNSVNGSEVLTITNTGAATFAGAITHTGNYKQEQGANSAPSSTDVFYIGGDNFASADASMYIGNRGNGTGYGWRLYYYGTGAGNLNDFSIQSENNGSPVDALRFNQDGTATFAGTAKAPTFINEASVIGTAAASYNLDSTDFSSIYVTADATANVTVNVRGDASTTLDGTLAVGDTISVEILLTNGATAYYNSAFQIDGVAQTVDWVDGIAPIEGTQNEVDAYQYQILKTATNTYTVIGSFYTLGTTTSKTFSVTSGTSGDATLIIESDTDNNNENDNPRLWFKQDGGIIESAVQMSNNTLDIINNAATGGGIRFLTGTTNNTGTTDPATGATERLRITSAGNVGIGNNNPSFFVDANGAIASRGNGIGNAAFVLQEQGNDPWYLEQFTGGSFSINYNGTSSANSKLSIDTAGNVGIGTSSPDHLLHLYKSTTGNTEPHILIDGPANSERAIIFADAGTDKWWIGRDNAGTVASGWGFYDHTAGAFAAYFTDNGIFYSNRDTVINGTLYTEGADALTPDATQPGAIVLANGGTQASPSTAGRGIEFLTADANNGYGHRLVSFDNTSGDIPLILQRRNNSAAWTTQVTFQGNSNAVDINGDLSVQGIDSNRGTGITGGRVQINDTNLRGGIILTQANQPSIKLNVESNEYNYEIYNSYGNLGFKLSSSVVGTEYPFVYNVSNEEIIFQAGGQDGLTITNNVSNTPDVTVAGTLTATSKSFDIEHPTKPNHRLRYGSLEGPENGVYVRGRLSGTEIELPEYWTALVDPDSITVSLTPIGPGSAWVEKIENNRITTGGSENCFYHVFAERVDIDKLVVEYENGDSI